MKTEISKTEIELLANRIYPWLEGKSDITKIKILLDVMEKEDFMEEISIRQEERHEVSRELIEKINSSMNIEEVVKIIKHL